MIVVESLLDREALPWQADWYRSKVEEHLGSAINERFRLWFTDNALHGDDELQESPLHTVSYLGVLQQALRDLSGWVEQDVAPPASTSYEVVDGQVIVPVDADGTPGRPTGGLSPGGRRSASRRRHGTRVHLPCRGRGPGGNGCDRRPCLGLRRVWVFFRRRAHGGGPEGGRGAPPRLRCARDLLSRRTCRGPTGGRCVRSLRPSAEPGARAGGRG